MTTSSRSRSAWPRKSQRPGWSAPGAGAPAPMFSHLKLPRTWPRARTTCRPSWTGSSTSRTPSRSWSRPAAEATRARPTRARRRPATRAAAGQRPYRLHSSWAAARRAPGSTNLRHSQRLRTTPVTSGRRAPTRSSVRVLSAQVAATDIPFRNGRASVASRQLLPYRGFPVRARPRRRVRSPQSPRGR